MNPTVLYVCLQALVHLMLNNNKIQEIGNLSHLSLANLLLLDLSNNQLKKV